MQVIHGAVVCVSIVCVVLGVLWVSFRVEKAMVGQGVFAPVRVG